MDILNYFKKEEAKQVTAESLLSATNSVLDAFKTVVNQLSIIRKQALDQAQIKQQEIDAAIVEKESLETLASNNEQIINKFKDLIN